MDGAFARFAAGLAGGLTPRLRRGKLSIATTPAGTPISDATQATKQRWKCAASRAAKMSPR
jgi:hypothetical protein